MNYKRFITVALIVLIAFPPGSAKGDVQEEIRLKAARLEELNKEIQATQQSLNTVQKQKSSLQREVQSLDTSIKQLDLKIQADSIAGEKLGLEINNLQTELSDIEVLIKNKQEAITRLYRALQKVDDENLITTILSNRSLAESFLDAQSITNLQTQLAFDINRLHELSASYRSKVGEMSNKKTEVALRQENLENRKAITADQKQLRQAVLAETKNQETLYQEKIKKLTEEQDALEDEISKIESGFLKNFDPNVLPTKRTGVLAWPVMDVRVTQHFGERSRLYRGKPHNGLDLGVPIGTPIAAADDGIVSAVDNNDQSAFRKYQYGRYVMVKHANNLATLYAHLSRQTVFVGQTVKRGEIIGYSGKTGYATGPHLHFGLYWAPTVEFKRVPPAAGLVPVGVVLRPEDYL